jgi:cation diffusion facilitator CzcD-associated flavoprotein CzcO
VIGAGVAGLQAIRALRGRGLPVTAFEATASVGGLWVKNYANFGVQVPKQLYEFQDFPMTSVERGEYATGPQVQSYIEDYASSFGLFDSIQFQSRVVSATKVRDGKSAWRLVVEQDGKEKVKEFDFLVVACGLYSGLNKRLPDISGLQDRFHGELVHSCDFSDASIARNKRTVVIGGGKSAVDCAVEAARAGATSVTVLQREAHWPTPRKIAGLIPFQYIFLSRFGTALVSAHHGTFPGGSGRLVNAFRDTVGPYVAWPIFRAVQELFAIQFGLRGDLRPRTDIVADFYDVALVLNSDFQKLRKDNEAVKVQLGEIRELKADGKALLLSDGTSVEADLIVAATGYEQHFDFFDDRSRNELDVQSDGLYLHRYVLPEKVPNLAFVGYVAAISNISTYGLQAEWLARYLTGDLVSGSIPNPKEIEERKAWARSWMPDTSNRGMLVLLHQTHYHDQLLRDMGENPSRKGGIAEYIMPYEPADYNGIMGGSPANG